MPSKCRGRPLVRPGFHDTNLATLHLDERVDFCVSVAGLVDEVPDAAPNAVAITGRMIDAEDVAARTCQDGTTRDLFVTLPHLVGRDPQEFLRPGHRLVTEIEGVGRIEQRII